MYREARVDEVRALSVLLSDFHRLVLPQISAGSLEEAARSSIDIKSSDILSYPGRSEVVLSDIQEEPNDSSSQVFPVCVAKHTKVLQILFICISYG